MNPIKRAAGLWMRGEEEISLGYEDLFISGTKYDNEKNFLNFLISKECGEINTIFLTGLPTLRSISNYVNRALKNPNATKPVGLTYLFSDSEDNCLYFRDETNKRNLNKYHLELAYDEWFKKMDELFNLPENIYVNIINSLKEDAYYDWEQIQIKYKHNNWPRNGNHLDFRVANEVYCEVLERALFWDVILRDSKNMERKLIFDGKTCQRAGAEIHSIDFFDVSDYYRQIAEICVAPKELFSRFIN